MTKDEIYGVLDKMLEDQKARNFLNHLVRSYMPMINLTQVIEKPKGDFKCVLTRQPLVSVNEVVVTLNTEEYKNQFLSSLKNITDNKTKDVAPLQTFTGDKILGVTGKNTTTFMSLSAAQYFYDWLITKSMKGHKHINWLLGNIKRESFLKRAETLQDPAVLAKIESYKKRGEDRSATFTLGETSDVLTNLKRKLETTGN